MKRHGQIFALALACALAAGAVVPVPTDEALEVLAGHGPGETAVSDERECLLAATLRGLTQAIARHVSRRGDPVRCEVVVFSKAWGELGRSGGAQELLDRHRVRGTAARKEGRI